MFVSKKRVITSLLTALTLTLFGPIFPATSTASSTDYEITSFDALVDVAGGTAGAATYADAAAVIAALPTSAYASSSRFSVLLQVTTWIDRDGYDSNSEGSYTFTADLGTLPDEWTNPGAIPLTVEVIIAPADLGTPDVNISNSAIEGVTPPAAGAVPVEVITPNDQFTGTVSWADKDGPLIGNFKSSTIYKATISLSAVSGYIFDGTQELIFTVAGANKVTFDYESSTAGVVTAYFTPAFADGADYLDNSFATSGTFNFRDIFGDTPINENNSAVGPVQVDRIAMDSEDRIVVLGSFYSDSANRAEIGAGYRNSLAVAAQVGNESTTSAAVTALEYRGGNRSDWYLPSRYELAELASGSATVGIVGEGLEYWASTEDGNVFAYVYIFDAPGEGVSYKDELRRMRPIRAGTLDTPTVGSTGPGGGIIFYETTTAFACGPTLSATCNYLEAAPNNWFSEEGDPFRTWATGAENQFTSVSIDHHILFRLNADGSYDHSFGNPGRTLRKNSSDTPKRYVPVTTTGISYTEKVDLEIDADDKILVMLSGSVIGAEFGKYHNFIARYTSDDGMIDTSFGDENDGAIGTIIAQSYQMEPLFMDFTIDSDDRILAISSNLSSESLAVTRFLPNGFLDDSFGEAESGTTLVDLTNLGVSSLFTSPVSNFQIMNDGSRGYIGAFSGTACSFYSDTNECLFDFLFTAFFRVDQGGLPDEEFNVNQGNEFDAPPNLMPFFLFTDLIPDGQSNFILSGTYFEPFGISQTSGLTVRLGIDGSPDSDFIGDGNGDAQLQPLLSSNCSSSAVNKYPELSQTSDSSIVVGEYCGFEPEAPLVLRLKTFSALGQYLGGFTLPELFADDYSPSINQMKVASDGKVLILSGSQPSSGLDAILSQWYAPNASYSKTRISRYQFSEPTSTPPPAPTPIPVAASAPPLTPYIKSLTAPKMHLKDEKLTCSAGTYNAGYTLSGVNQGSATSLATPSRFTYKLFFDGIAQESLTVISESATALWKMPNAPTGALISCSVTVSVNGVTISDKSTDNDAGVVAAMDAQVSAKNRAQIDYPESLTASSDAYEKALKDNRLTWQSNIEKQRRNYQARLAKIKSVPATKATRASATRALDNFRTSRAKILANYKARNQAALAAKELAERNALISRDAAIAKAKETYSSFIESLGYGVLIP